MPEGTGEPPASSPGAHTGGKLVGLASLLAPHVGQDQLYREQQFCTLKSLKIILKTTEIPGKVLRRIRGIQSSSLEKLRL